MLSHSAPSWPDMEPCNFAWLPSALLCREKTPVHRGRLVRRSCLRSARGGGALCKAAEAWWLTSPLASQWVGKNDFESVLLRWRNNAVAFEWTEAARKIKSVKIPSTCCPPAWTLRWSSGRTIKKKNKTETLSKVNNLFNLLSLCVMVRNAVNRARSLAWIKMIVLLKKKKRGKVHLRALFFTPTFP